ncbi:hypothetical protein [Acinetobacter johnsonii]|uniref:hypothetical protein n=1 Tax=Acinetobacter johnsonii TaxID=40214 RepID=UPI003AF4A864
MVASTDIKFFVHSNNNAPQLQNAFGSMISVLDVCLVNGINIGPISSLTASGTTITALFSSAHNLMQYQVIKITGAAQSEFNGEHRILTVPNAQSVTFELAAAPSTTTATGTITASLPPLGWEKPFSSSNPTGGGKAAYRSKNLLLSSRPFLRVVDELDPAYTTTYAKYAKVGIVEDMTDIDTMLGVQAPYDSGNPNKNWVGTGSGTSVINGWARWYYARNFDLGNTYDTKVITEGNRNWLLVGNADYFYIMPCFHTGQSPANPYGFGSFERYYDDDLSNTFLSASIKNTPPANFEQIGKLSGVSSTNNYNFLLFKPIEQTSDYATANVAYSINNTSHYSGCTAYLKGASNKVPLYPIILEEQFVKYSGENLKTVRGGLSGIYALAQYRPLNDFQIFRRGSSAFIARYSTIHDNNADFGELVLKIGDL